MINTTDFSFRYIGLSCDTKRTMKPNPHTQPQILRRTHPALLALAFLVLLLCVTLVFLFVELPEYSLFWNSLQNAGHTLIMTLLTVSLLTTLLFATNFTEFQKYLVVAVAISIVSAIAEFAQHFIGRDASILDILLNYLGYFVGALLFRAGQYWYHSKPRESIALLSIASVILLATLYKSINYAIVSFLYPPFPVLANFDSYSAISRIHPLENTKLQTSPSPLQWSENSTDVLEMNLSQAMPPGFQLMDIYQDWSSHKTLAFDVFNPHETTIAIRLRIHDALHNNLPQDRYRRPIIISPGLQKITVPLNDVHKLVGTSKRKRNMDMARIVGFIIYAKTHSDQSIYFDNFELE